MDGQIFGEVASIVHVIEFEKRGLPHTYFLIILKPSYKYLTPEAYDRIVNAELPDKNDDPYLYNRVFKHMMHGLCVELNPTNVCMVNDKCKNHYPKEYNEFTTHGKGSYPIYRRKNDGRTAQVRGSTLENHWVVPYNPKLLLEFDCHMNVKICCDIRAVKYLYKYVHKGYDKVIFHISPENSSVDTVIDEIANFQKARWVSLPEAAWRISEFPLSGMYPAVIRLQVHLPDFHSVQFYKDADMEDIIHDERLKRTMLTEFFSINSIDLSAKKLNVLYKYFPKYYVWDSQLMTWTKRKSINVIGRLAIFHPVESERYYLRILLNNVCSPTSFDSPMTVGGVLCQSFQDAAFKKGLLHNNDDIDNTMQEACVYGMPIELRGLFATLLYYCNPANPRILFEYFYEHMVEDFKTITSQQNLREDQIIHRVLQGINDTLESLGKNVNEYYLVPFKFVATKLDNFTREIIAKMSIPIPEEDLLVVHQLNANEKVAFDIIFDLRISNAGGSFFVDKT